MAGTVTVYGGTGFLGRRISGCLLRRGYAVRIASRHPERARALAGEFGPRLDSVLADVNDEASVTAAVSGSFAVVNAVSLYVERAGRTFRSVHVDAAARVARLAQSAGVEKLVHVSGIGADPGSSSPYIRSRGEGENAVRDGFPAATLIRPAVMFGCDDAFVAPLARMLRRLPVFPMFGRGRTRLQPVHVGDVAEATARLLAHPDPAGVYELAGPAIYTYGALLRLLARQLDTSVVLIPVPFGAWRAAALLAERLPRPPITRNQVELMQIDNVATPDAPGFSDLGLVPRFLEASLSGILGSSPGA